MRLSEWNTLADGPATDHVRPCVAIERWSRELTGGRPYPDVARLLAAADASAAGWSPDEVDAALDGHPRIGEHGGARERGEQDGVTAEHLAALADGNRRYEQTFGRIYLVRAAGRSGDELLRLLQTRLDNRPDVEATVVHEQLREITLLRLEGMLT